MKHIAAYLLLTTGGNASPSAKQVSDVLASVGVDSDEARLESLISELKGKSLDELISAGSAKLASVPSGGSAAASSSSLGAQTGSAAAPEAAAPAKEEEKEESDEDMGFGLFD